VKEYRARRKRKSKIVSTAVPEPADHCDDYIDDLKAPMALRTFLAFARSPAHGYLQPLPHPQLFATFEGRRVRVTMASRFGDVGITDRLDVATGYDTRVRVSQLVDFSEQA